MKISQLFPLRVKTQQSRIDLVVVIHLAPITATEIHTRQQPSCSIVRCEFCVRRLVNSFPHRLLPLAWSACNVWDSQCFKHSKNLAVTRSERKRTSNTVMRHRVNLLNDSHHVFPVHSVNSINKFRIEPLSLKEGVVIKGIWLNRQDAGKTLLAGITADIICSHCLINLKSHPRARWLS